jgi:hypothetical protein
MHLMASQAGKGRLLCQLRIVQSPRSLHIERYNQVPYATGKVHAVAPQTVVGQMLPAIVRFIEKEFPVRHGMRTGRPVGVFLPMAFGAACAHLFNIVELQPDLFRNFSSQVGSQTANIFPMKARIRRENVAVAIGAKYVAVRGGMPIRIGLPDFVATGTRTAAGVTIIDTRAGQQQSRTKHEQQQNEWAPVPVPASCGRGVFRQ